MGAMWPETEKLAENGLAAFACNSNKPAVEPAGAIKPLFGTNPITIAWHKRGEATVDDAMVTEVSKVSKDTGVAVLAIKNSHHLAAMGP